VIPDDEVERVRDVADIVAIIGEFVTLRRVGTDFRGACPFHQGTHRNFSVSARRKIYHCFVCGEGGDVFTFLQKRLGLDWPDAVRMAASKSGIALREVNARRDGPDPREPLWEVNAAAQAVFARSLWDDQAGAPAREYLAQRDVSRAVAERFGLGFAPREIGLLRGHLTALGFSDERQMEAGVLTKREDVDEPRPRFRGRLIFPIYDAAGRVAGFGGRILGPGEPKYLNSAETVAFTKGKLLYGLSWARNAIRRAERVLLVEGYFDLVRLAAAGIEEVVAPLGTALTPEQAELIARQSKNVFLLYDSDRAGLKATFRAGDALLRGGAAVRVVSLPEGEDPDTFVRAHGSEALERQISQSMDVFERKVQLLQRGGWFADLHRRRRAIDLLLPTIRATEDQVTRDLYLGRAAEASGVDRSVLGKEAAEGRVHGRRESPRVAEPMGLPPPRRSGSVRGHSGGATSGGGVLAHTSAERELVRVMLSLRSTVEQIGERIGPDQFRDARYREIFEVLSQLGPEATNEEVAGALSPGSTQVVDALLAEPEAVQNTEKVVHDCLARLELRALRERNAEIQRLLGAAKADEKNTLVAEKQANSDEIRRLTESVATT
jgi:DNA primase